MKRNLGIDGSRLWASLMDMAKIGATAKGGNARLAASDLDRDGRNLFVRWAKEAGCTVSVDRIGNIFIRRAGRDPRKAPVVTGSHLDTQPTGGRFDGIYGVLAAFEALEALVESSRKPRNAFIVAQVERHQRETLFGHAFRKPANLGAVEQQLARSHRFM